MQSIIASNEASPQAGKEASCSCLASRGVSLVIGRGVLVELLVYNYILVSSLPGSPVLVPKQPLCVPMWTLGLDDCG